MKYILVAGNWKMNTNAFESEKLAEYIAGGVSGRQFEVGVLLCPPFTSLERVSKTLKDSNVRLGAQNCSPEPKGAFTGEISIPMLKYLKCSHVIIGHSERRAIFGETSEQVNRKLKALLDRELTPVMCVGENLDERKSGKTFEVVEDQLVKGFDGVDSQGVLSTVIAYEPVWAIGTGVAAEIEQIAEAHARIREFLVERFGPEVESMLLLYGGSVKESNAEEIFSVKDVNGGLIGGASLDPEGFLKIIEIAEKIVSDS